jgi:phosphomannomutase
MSASVAITIGPSGWRDVLAHGFTTTNLYRISQAIKECGIDSSIVIGYDTRFLSRQIAIFLTKLLKFSNNTVVMIDEPCPTPTLAFVTKKHTMSLGIMVTSSHNPYYYQGLKFFGKNGAMIPRETQRDLEKKANAISNIPNLKFPEELPSDVEIMGFPTEYLEGVLSQLNVDAIRQRKLRVVFDAIYGTNQFYFPTLFNLLGISHEGIDVGVNAEFGGRHPEPRADTLDKLKQVVGSSRASLGLTTDPDGDRFGVVDQQGTYIDNNFMLALFAWYLVKHKKLKGLSVCTDNCSMLLRKVVKSEGQELQEVPVGFANIGEIFTGSDNPLAGYEESGGFAIADHLYYKDGLLACLLVLEMVSVTGMSLFELLEKIKSEFGTFVYHRFDIPIRKNSFSSLQDRISLRTIEKIWDVKCIDQTHISGDKFIFDNDSWLMMRPSRTEPLIRVYAEARKSSHIQKLGHRIQKYLNLKA